MIFVAFALKSVFLHIPSLPTYSKQYYFYILFTLSSSLTQKNSFTEYSLPPANYFKLGFFPILALRSCPFLFNGIPLLFYDLITFFSCNIFSSLFSFLELFYILFYLLQRGVCVCICREKKRKREREQLVCFYLCPL